MPLAPKGSKANYKSDSPKTLKPSQRPAAKKDAKVMAEKFKQQVKSDNPEVKQAARRQKDAAANRLIKSGGIPKAATKNALKAGIQAFKAKTGKK